MEPTHAWSDKVAKNAGVEEEVDTAMHGVCQFHYNRFVLGIGLKKNECSCPEHNEWGSGDSSILPIKEVPENIRVCMSLSAFETICIKCKKNFRTSHYRNSPEYKSPKRRKTTSTSSTNIAAPQASRSLSLPTTPSVTSPVAAAALIKPHVVEPSPPKLRQLMPKTTGLSKEQVLDCLQQTVTLQLNSLPLQTHFGQQHAAQLVHTLSDTGALPPVLTKIGIPAVNTVLAALRTAPAFESNKIFQEVAASFVVQPKIKLELKDGKEYPSKVRRALAVCSVRVGSANAIGPLAKQMFAMMDMDLANSPSHSFVQQCEREYAVALDYFVAYLLSICDECGVGCDGTSKVK